MNREQLLEILAYNIRRRRQESGCTQANLAEMVDITVEYMCEIENGRSWPGVKIFSALAVALKVEPYQLVIPTTESPYFDKHYTLSAFSKHIKFSIADNIDELCHRFAQVYDSS